MKPKVFNIANDQDILSGLVTDVYFDRTVRILKAKKVNPVVKAELIVKSMPGGQSGKDWPWAVLAGLDEAMSLLKGLPVKVRAIEDGTVFYPYEPILEIEGRYLDFCVYETALLGFLCQASGIATQAARFKMLAGERMVLSFGARRMHPALAPMIERNAYIGGCDGVSVIESGQVIGREAVGTMPHALIICMGGTVEAALAFDEVIGPGAMRVVLIDTFQDEKFECLNVARALGKKLDGVRFDTPSSRRGDFYRILEECRWELDQRGFGHVKFFVSGGIKEADVARLNPLVSGYGIGTSISNAPVVDIAMDIMEVEGKPLAKRGKWSGGKRVLRCKKCGGRMTIPLSGNTPECGCGGEFVDILIPALDNGRLLIPEHSPHELRERTLLNIKGLEL
ncbi:MAG: nicotinate phosphoribosyltransferase [Actinomycetota bacterium]|nr:nicotinate phosphoribosyltransferase [Actinomycetota bacterium]